MKLKYLFLSLLLMMGIVSCGPSTSSNLTTVDLTTQRVEPLPIEEKAKLIQDYKAETYITLESLNQLDLMLQTKQEFLLYIFDTGCESCKLSTPVVNAFIKNTQARVYAINTANPETNLNPSNRVLPYLGTPTLMVIKNGEILARFSPSLDSELFLNATNMEKGIKEYCFISNQIEVSTQEQLDSIISGDAIVYFYWSKCGDCNYFDANYLDEYFRHENRKIVYYFALDEYFALRKDSSDPIYKNVTDKYGISQDGSEFGYKNGVVPTFGKYSNGKIIDAKVIYNDEMTYEMDGETLVSVTVTGSYYKDCPYLNKTFKSSDTSWATDVYHKETLSFFESKILEIL